MATRHRTSNEAAVAAYEHGRAAATERGATIDRAALARLTRQRRTGVERWFLAGVNARLNDTTQPMVQRAVA
jgi:hypothetical protein